jgi:serine/threonine protein kinase
VAKLTIIEPDAERRWALEQCLACRFEVSSVVTGAEGLACIKQGRADAVVVSDQIPDPGVGRWISAARALRGSHRLPIVVVASTPSDDQAVAVLTVGATDYIPLPCHPAVLAARMEAHLRATLFLRRVTGRAEEGHEFRTGQMLAGKYALEQLIGQGGSSVVFRAHDVHLEREVAVKILRPGRAWDPTILRRFQVEGASACRIHHPNAVQVLDFGVAMNSTPYLVMELLSGHTLANEIDARPPETLLPVGRIAEVMGVVCEVMLAAHRAGVLHRDLKPDNIFLAKEDGREVVKVLDFGIARLEGAGSITAEGTVVGTPQYMAPERLTGTQGDAGADVYSLGVVLFEALTGQLPFGSVSDRPIEAALLQIHGTARSLRVLRPTTPPPLLELVEAMLARGPEARPGLDRAMAVLAEVAVEAGQPPKLPPKPAQTLQGEGPVARRA